MDHSNIEQKEMKDCYFYDPEYLHYEIVHNLAALVIKHMSKKKKKQSKKAS